MFACGIIGFFLRRGGYPAGPMILGILLGYMLESNLRRTLVMSRGSYAIFFTRPVSCVLMLFTLFSLCWPLLKKYVFKKKTAASAE